MPFSSRLIVSSLLLGTAALALYGCGNATDETAPVQSNVESAGAETSSATLEGETDENARLAIFFEETFERDVENSPMFQAQLGRKTEDYGKWDDFSEAEERRQVEQAKADLTRLRTEFVFEALDEQSRIGYRIFEYNQENAIKNYDWRYNQYPVTQMSSVVTYLPTFMQNIHRIDTVGDAEDYISRLNGIEEVIGEVIKDLKVREARGVIAPKLVYPGVIGSAQAVISGAPFDDSDDDSAIMSDFRAKINALDVSDAEKEQLLERGKAALTGPFLTSYTAFINEMTRLSDLADGDKGAWSLPDGVAYYARRIEHWTTVSMDPEEIHQLGLEEVARIRAEMESIKNEVGFDGSLAEFFEFVRTDPNNYYPDTQEGRDQYLADATELIEEVYEKTDEYFNILPKAPLEVRPVEKWRENAAGTAFYNRPAPDGSRPGIYYINMKDMNDVQKHIMNSLAYHEGAPGHHFQLAIMQELQGIPEFRKYGGYSAYTEGWALYTERLAWEMGLYEGRPMRDFGRLAEEMKRAVRLVVDTGMHAKEWTLQEAIDYMTENTPMAPGDIERQNKRYMVWPGQALSYKIGMIKLLELREKARTELGEEFDIRDYHDVVLKNGAMPLAVLEDVVNAYIDERKAQ
ncbi:DUF885 family protein [Parvularcula sp. IMCC14364]|uniref:DUF885 domain-containing protein n=1 Tax=Parvularcula sp. IMCC14364 TaxID=3067902 RepID=UPI002742192D|nr:DUF885 domain-containing protein [Parvularcula sp. IMCC14364]